MHDLVTAISVLFFGTILFWLSAVLLKIVRSDDSIYERNRISLGTVTENLLGRNPYSADAHAQMRGQVFVLDDDYMEEPGAHHIPKGRFVPNAKLSDDFVDDILKPH